MKEEILGAQIADQLRRNILLGKLPPGAAIKERDNAAELGVSRTPLREAIRMLATEGLVELRPARSPIVAVKTVKQIQDDVEVLVASEQLSGELACQRASDQEIDALSVIVADMDKRFDTADPIDMFEIDMNFHRAIAKASHNESLAQVHSEYLARLWRARYMSAMQQRNRARVIDHHSEIVAALRARDVPRTRAAINNHLGNLCVDIVRVIEAEAQPPTPPSG